MRKKLSLIKRASLTRQKMAQKLLKLMELKKSNLCLAIDLVKQNDLLEMASALGPEICVLKTHVDLLEDFTPDFGKKLQAIARKHHFLIFEDRKFADIGQTVLHQYTKGIYRIADWADIVNAHIVPGPGIIEGLKGSHLLLLAEMSSSGTLAKGAYARKAVQFAEEFPETVIGFICQRRLTDHPGLIHFTPGVKLTPGKDALGQCYRTVEDVLIKHKSDIIIVGRDITSAACPKTIAQEYRERGWSAYQKTINC